MARPSPRATSEAVQSLGMNKAPDAFRTISEVAEELDVPQHVLRFWETRFTSIRPLKRGGGRRYYRPDDVELLKGIRQLLYGQGYTIKGVQRILKEDGARVVQEVGRGGVPPLQRAADANEQDSGLDVPIPTPPAPMRVEQVPFPQEGAAYESRRAAAEVLGGSDMDRLKGALAELLECRRVLDGLKRR